MTTLRNYKLPTAKSRHINLMNKPSKEFKDYFSKDSIIKELCRARIKLSKKRNDALFIHRISKDKPSAERQGVGLHEELEGLFPPRRTWVKFRPRRDKRINKDSQSINTESLERAIKILMGRNPNQAWAIKLKARVEQIRARALGSQKFIFESPRVIGVEKDIKIHTFRPLAVYNTDDKIIECITARYLRQNLDFVFLPSSLAFRSPQGNQNSPVTTHTALERIRSIREKYDQLYVAEADIRSFFDCVCHKIARDSLKSLIIEAKKTRADTAISKRAIAIFGAYLNSYSFQKQVLVQGLSQIKSKNHLASFPWPESTLKSLHSRKTLPPIGIPQGGALSCFIANLVLHKADHTIEQLRKKRKSAICYMRYCDDMIIIAPQKSMCRAAMDAYKAVSMEIKLPLHEPEMLQGYVEKSKIEFWKLKSKSTYSWSNDCTIGVPWVQFVGYQIRYDGLVRIREKSLKKHFRKLTTTTDEMLNALNPGSKKLDGIPIFAPGLRKNHHEIQHRFKMKLLSLAVGRRKLGQDMPETADEIMPMCWAKGFRGLKGTPFISSHLKSLDRHRERQLRRIKSRLKHLPKSISSKKDKNDHHIRYYGSPFSYYGQFK